MLPNPILIIATLVIAARGLQDLPGVRYSNDNPLYPSSLRFTGKTKNPPDGFWLVDTSPGGAAGYMGERDRGATYYFTCGPSRSFNFRAETCGDLSMGKLICDVPANWQPFVDGELKMCSGKLTETLLTVWTPSKLPRTVSVHTFKDACGWLGGRCGEGWNGAKAYIFKGSDVRSDALEIDVDMQALGAIQITWQDVPELRSPNW